VAYLKKGKGRKSAGNDALDGVHITFDALTFSPSDAEKVSIPFGKLAVAMSTVDGEATPIESNERSLLVAGDPCPKCGKKLVTSEDDKLSCPDNDCGWHQETMTESATQAQGAGMSTAEQWAKDGAFYVELRKELRAMIKEDA